MFKKILVAVISVIINTSAFALPPSMIPDIEIYMSGSSSQDIAVSTYFSDLCASGSLDVYKDIANPTKPGKEFSAYFCNIDSNKVAGLSLTNPKVLLHKRSFGGSVQGVNPVIDEKAIDVMVINNGNCTNVSAGSYECTINKSDGDLLEVIFDVGVSDVNPEMFIGMNIQAGSNPVDADVVSNKMEVQGASALVFGITVTTTLRNALQEAQFGVSDDCVGDETEACMPNLTSNQITSIFGGAVKKWDDVYVNGVSLTTNSTLPPADTKVIICGRTQGSGALAQLSAKYFRYPCVAGATKPTSTGNIFLGPRVLLNSSSGNTALCLSDFNNGTNNGGLNQILPHIPSAPVTGWAIAVQSTEKNATLYDDYRFVKIDGYAPTLENAAAGRYRGVVEPTFQWRIAGANPLTGDKLAIVDTIVANASSPTILATRLNTKFNHTWGQAGYMALTTNGFTTSLPFDTANPVTPYSHAPSGLTLDNCRVPLINSGNMEL